MGYYLNPVDALGLYKGETEKPFFIDKTEMLSELIFLVEHGRNYLAVTRPRRFGKSVIAAMIGSYFGKGVDSSEVFDSLKIASNKSYAKHLNQHNLIYIDFSRAVEECRSYDEYISTIKGRLFKDLKEAYPEAEITEKDSVGAALRIVSMANSIRYWNYFGFTSKEVDELYQRYLDMTPVPYISREDLKEWYDGYHKERRESIYNPNSVVLALSEDQVGNYWSKGGEYDELKDYVMNDIDGVREAVMLLVAGEP